MCPRPEGPAGVLRDVVAAAPDFALSVWCLVTWFDPYRFGTFAVRSAVLMLLMEFIIIHSSGFLGAIGIADDEPRPRRVLMMFGLGLFYTLFVGAFAWEFRTWMPLVAFWGLMLNRMLGVLVGAPKQGAARAYVMAGWAATTAFYILFVGLTSTLSIPAFGVTADVIASQHFTSTGIWPEQPYRVLCLGALYYGAVGVSELAAHRWIARRRDRERAELAGPARPS